MMTELKCGACWLNFITYKDCNVIIKLFFKRKIEKKYTEKVQKLCKTFKFGKVDKSWPRDLNQELFEDIVN